MVAKMGGTMADPTIASLTANTWNLVATSVSAGFIWIRKTDVQYLQTYRNTGNPAPTLKTEGAPVYLPGAPISANVPIDVYIYPVDDDGEVRIDI